MSKVDAVNLKRLFFVLIFFSFCLVCLSIYCIWVVTSPGLSKINEFLPVLSGIFSFGVCLVLASGVSCIGLTMAGVSVPKLFQKLAWSSVNFLFSLALIIGKVFKIDKEKIERSFIAASNHLILKRGINVKPEKLLILTPHCIQKESCTHKVTNRSFNCRRCGACQVGDLLDIAENFGTKLVIVTGGTLARRVIKELKPQAVLAIACERDLTSGIQEVFPMPVIGILNERPCGPCVNTKVDLESVKKTIENLCGAKF